METHSESNSSQEECGYSSPGSYPPSLEPEDPVIKKSICNIVEILPNTMREFDFQNRKILIARQRGKFHAVSARCSNCDSSLVEGSLGRGRVRCPHCGSCFSLYNGDIEDAPTLYLLPCYQVDVDGETVYVSISQRELSESGTHLIPTATVSGSDNKKELKEIGSGDQTGSRWEVSPTTSKDETRETIVVVGGGPCAAVCIEQLRRLGFTGRLVAFMQEPQLPYDRTLLSKYLDIHTRDPTFRSPWFYEDIDVEIYRSTTVELVNVRDRTVERSDGGVTAFDKIFIATGCRAKRLPPEMPGAADAGGLFYVRTISDVQAIHEAISRDKDLVIVGSSFLGMEMAATCVPHAKSITIISDTAYPFENLFGTVLGERLLKLFKDRGCIMRMSSEIVKLELNQDNLNVTGIALSDGRLVPAQIVIACIGVEYNTELLADSGVALSPDGAVLVDECLNTNIPFLWAGGDVACTPTTGRYQSAMTQGRVAAATMLGIETHSQTVPYVTIALAEVTLHYVGRIVNEEDMVLTGDLDGFKFAAYYFDGDIATGIVMCGLQGLAAKFAESIQMEKYVTRRTVRDHVWIDRMFICPVHDRDEDYTLDLDKMRALGLVF